MLLSEQIKTKVEFVELNLFGREGNFVRVKESLSKLSNALSNKILGKVTTLTMRYFAFDLPELQQLVKSLDKTKNSVQILDLQSNGLDQAAAESILK